MKTLVLIIASLLMVCVSQAGESALTTTYQPLSELGTGRIAIVHVTCHRWHANDVGSAVDLIHARNVPPTDNPKDATQDLNLASRCGLKFSTNDLGALPFIPMIRMDATKFVISKSGGYSKDDIVRASLECLRRCLPEKLKNTKITLISRDEDKEWLSKIVAEFDAAPRDQPFYATRFYAPKSAALPTNVVSDKPIVLKEGQSVALMIEGNRDLVIGAAVLDGELTVAEIDPKGRNFGVTWEDAESWTTSTVVSDGTRSTYVLDKNGDGYADFRAESSPAGIDCYELQGEAWIKVKPTKKTSEQDDAPAQPATPPESK